MILVTGATGLIGLAIVRALREAGHPVRILVRPWSRLEPLAGLDLDRVEGDVRDPASLAPAVEGVESVFHCAAKVALHGIDERILATTLHGTLNVARAAIQAGVRRFVYLSSVAVYGQGEEGTVTEDQPYHAAGPYSRAKIECETALLEMHRQGDLDVRILRPSLVYGPHDRNFLPSTLQLLRMPVVPLVDRGRALTDVVHAADVARAALLAWQHEQAAGRAYHVTDGQAIRWRDFFDRVARLAGLQPRYVDLPGWLLEWLTGVFHRLARAAGPRYASFVHPSSVGAYRKDRVYSIERARSELGFEPRVALEDGLAETLAWFRKTGRL